MAKTDDASTSDKGTPVVTYVRVGRGMVKVTKYEKEDKSNAVPEGSIHSLDSSQPEGSRAPSVKSRASSHNHPMPSWVPKFKKKKNKKQVADLVVASEHPPRESPLPPVPHHVQPSSSATTLAPPSPGPLRPTHSHGDLPHATPDEMWSSISQLESELVARYGRGAVPHLEALRERIQQLPNAHRQPREQPVEPPREPRPRVRTETLPARSRPAGRAFVEDLNVYPQQPVQTEEPEEDSDDAAAYLQALGIEEPKPIPKPKPVSEKATYQRSPRSSTLPSTLPPAYTTPEPQDDTLLASIASHPSPALLEHYATHQRLPRSDYVTTRRAPDSLMVDTPRSISPYSPPGVDTPITNSPASTRRKRDLPPQPPPPNTFAPYAPTAPLNVRSVQSSPASSVRAPSVPRPQPSPNSLTVPSPHTPRTPQLSLPLVRVRITSPPNRGAIRTLPALVLLTPLAKAAFAAATWAQMVTFCARNAGVSIARRGGGGNLLISIEERMADVISPGGGRGVGDEEVGFGLGYYVSVEMNLEEDGASEGPGDSVPVAQLLVPLPTTMGEVASVFRERKDIRKALS